MEVIAGHDPLDSTSRRVDVPAYAGVLERSGESPGVDLVLPHPASRERIRFALKVPRVRGGHQDGRRNRGER